MDTDGHGLRRAENNLTKAVIGGAFEVLNALGHGLHEKPYENALVVELSLRRILCEQQRWFPVWYKEVQVAEFVPDLLAGGSVVADAKVIERITDLERWPDAELSSYNWPACRPDPEFQTPQTGKGACRALNLCSSVSICG